MQHGRVVVAVGRLQLELDAVHAAHLGQRRIAVVGLDMGGMTEAHVAQQVAQRLVGVELAVVVGPAGDLFLQRIAHRFDQLVELGVGIGERAFVGREVGRCTLGGPAEAAKLSCAMAGLLSLMPRAYSLVPWNEAVWPPDAGSSKPVPTIAPPSATMAWPLT